ncbi:unnamed protein product, partial [Brassica rapa]
IFFSTVVLIDEYAETAMKKILLELKPCNLIMYLTKLQEPYISLHNILLAHASATNNPSRQQPDSMTLLDGKPNESNVEESTIFYLSVY